jgi:hypothetical protein
MLKDRKTLLEHELAKAHKEAANTYLSIVVGGHSVSDDTEYAKQRDRVSALQFDLNMVNSLIAQGQE